MNRVVIVSCVRTPIHGLLGGLSSVTAPKLGSVAILESMKRAGITGNEVDEVIMGNVISAGVGQAPARQAAIGAGLNEKTVCLTINKVCASGLKAIALGAQSIQLGHANVIIAGGFESMSNIPFYDMNRRKGQKYGHGEVKDGIILDGLWDVYNNFAMGNCAEDCAKKFGFTREMQDDFAFQSYNRAKKATLEKKFQNEIVGVPVTVGKKTNIVTDDEIITKYDFEESNKTARLIKPAFIKDGTVTAFNSSKINDGAASFVLMNEDFAKANGFKPIARILSYADTEQAPIEFTTAPSKAIPLALKRAGLKIEDVGAFEINEAFAAVALANIKLLNLDPEIVNMYGGAVSLGHPIGASGARIAVTLNSVLHQTAKKPIGVASICNGGGGATALVIESL